MHEGDVLVLELLHVADDLGLGVVRVEDGVRHEGRGSLEGRVLQAALEVRGAREHLGKLEKKQEARDVKKAQKKSAPEDHLLSNIVEVILTS